MIILYMIIVGFAILAAGISGIATSKNFLVIMFSIELIIIAASLIGLTLYSSYGGDIILLLISIWSIASVELIAAIALYRYLVKSGNGLDVSKLSKYKG